MVVAAGLAAWKQRSVLEQPLALHEVRLLDVQAGDTPGGLFRQLEADGLLQDSLWLRLYWRMKLGEQPLHSGEDRLSTGVTARDMITPWQKAEIVQYSLTVVEGWNFRQLRTALIA